jgi:FkbM family methyltransferase
MSVYLGDYTAICKVDLGCKMYVDTRDQSLAPHLLVEGVWETWVTNVIRKYLRGAVFIDVGANFGWYSCAACVSGAKGVFSYEPNPRLAELIRKTADVNGFSQWNFRSYALGDVNGHSRLSYSLSHFGNGSTTSEVGTSEEWVQVKRFDETADAEMITAAAAPVVMKIDVEGADGRVILGAENFIRGNNCTLFVEYSPAQAEAERVYEAHEMLRDLGYSIGHVTRESTIRPLKYGELESVPASDMLCFYKIPR